MNGREKSDPVIVAVKSPNKTGEPAAEAMERRVGAEENARQRRTRRTQSRESVTPTPERVRTAARFCRHYPRWEPDAGKPHVRICAGGPGQPGSLPRYPKAGVPGLHLRRLPPPDSRFRGNDGNNPANSQFHQYHRFLPLDDWRP